MREAEEREKARGGGRERTEGGSSDARDRSSPSERKAESSAEFCPFTASAMIPCGRRANGRRAPSRWEYCGNAGVRD